MRAASGQAFRVRSCLWCRLPGVRALHRQRLIAVLAAIVVLSAGVAILASLTLAGAL